MILAIIIEIALLCCRDFSRKVPNNYIALGTFTLLEAFIFSVICSQYDKASCITAAGLTAAVTCALTGYAYWTKRDFTICGQFFTVIFFGMMALFVMSFFMAWVSWWHPVVSVIFICVYGLFLIYDTQMILGRGEYKLTVDDYIIGALILYMDIMRLFLELLRLFGDRN
jgi:protein lifeguard